MSRPRLWYLKQKGHQLLKLNAEGSVSFRSLQTCSNSLQGLGPMGAYVTWAGSLHLL